MKTGDFLGGLAVGALVGLGVGYVLGTDAEKRKRWLYLLGDKVSQFKGKVSCCADDAAEAVAGVIGKKEKE